MIFYGRNILKYLSVWCIGSTQKQIPTLNLHIIWVPMFKCKYIYSMDYGYDNVKLMASVFETNSYSNKYINTGTRLYSWFLSEYHYRKEPNWSKINISKTCLN